MYKIKSIVYRAAHGMLAVILLAVTTTAMLLPGLVPEAAAGQVSTRSIQMSSSTPGATGVTYNLSFKPASTYTVKGLALDFCTGDPFVDNTTCTAPTGFNAGTAATTSIAGTWTNGALYSGGGIYSTWSTGQSITGGTAYTWTLTNVTNPSTTCSSGTACTFYARFTTWTTTTGASGYTHGAGSYQDYGGFALSTATAISITAKVMEALSFCVYLGTGSCGTAPTLTLGHGGNVTLDTTVVDTATIKYDLSTNALSGVTVNLKGNTLTSGSNTIPAVGASPTAITPGTAAFGVNVATTATSGTLSVPSKYATGTYGLDMTTANSNLTYTYGDPISTSTAPVNGGTGTLTYGATASSTTPAGIYTATHQLIATGTF